MLIAGAPIFAGFATLIRSAGCSNAGAGAPAGLPATTWVLLATIHALYYCLLYPGT